MQKYYNAIEWTVHQQFQEEMKNLDWLKVLNENWVREFNKINGPVTAYINIKEGTITIHKEEEK